MSGDTNTGRAFRWSLLLHGGAVGAVLVWMLLNMAFHRVEKPPHVMELVGGPPVENPEPRNAAPKQEAPAPQMPSLPALDKREITPPKPEPQPVAKPQPKPEPAKEAKPTPEKKPELIDYKTFAKQNKLPPKVQQAPAKPTPAKPVATPKLDSASVLRDLRANLSKEDSDKVSSMSIDQQGQLFDYFQWVRALIDKNFRVPAGAADGRSAWVEFRIGADGTVSAVRLVTNSGDAAFDNAALAAVRALGKLSPPPGNTAYTRKIELRAEKAAMQ